MRRKALGLMLCSGCYNLNKKFAGKTAYLPSRGELMRTQIMKLKKVGLSDEAIARALETTTRKISVLMSWASRKGKIELRESETAEEEKNGTNNDR